MTKDVILKVQGLQVLQGDAGEVIEVISPGEYYFRNGKHYFLYDEVMEGVDSVTKNVIKVKDDYMELTKKGAVNVHMVFERDKQNISYYYTPYGSLQIGVDAGRVLLQASENEIAVEVLYDLDINSEHIANCRIRMTAVPKGSEDFTLLS